MPVPVLPHHAAHTRKTKRRAITDLFNLQAPYELRSGRYVSPIFFTFGVVTCNKVVGVGNEALDSLILTVDMLSLSLGKLLVSS